MSIVRVVDFETTGEAPPAEVCEVGYADVDVERRAIAEHASWLCGVSLMPPVARAVHHIRLAECAGKPPFDPGELTARPASAYVAHNAAFETAFFTPPAPMICTYKAALRVWPDAPSHGNGALFYWLQDAGLVTDSCAHTLPAHRAGPDAYVTAYLFLALLAAGAAGRDMVQWTREPALLPRCPIGKWRGHPWSDVDQGFLEWMLRTPDMDAGLKWNAEQELNRRKSDA